MGGPERLPTTRMHLTSSVSPFFVIRIGPPSPSRGAWVVTVDKDVTTAILSPRLAVESESELSPSFTSQDIR